MLFLQAIEATKVLDSAFGIDPGKVFGFLVAFQIFVLIGVTWAVIYLWRENQAIRKKLEDLTSNAITVISNNVSVLNTLDDSIGELRTGIPKHIDAVEDRLQKEVSRNGEEIKRVLTKLEK